MGTTPNRGLPFPEDPDTPNVPRDIKALAMALDAPMRMIRTPVTSSAFQAFRPNWTGTVSDYKGFAYDAQWQFTAPEDGVLALVGSFRIGHMSGLRNVAAQKLDFYLRVEPVRGSSNIIDYPLYGRTVSGPYPTSGTTDHIDQTHTLARNVFVPKGDTVAPVFMFRGTLTVANKPQYSAARINGLWIPGQMTLEDATTTGGLAQPYKSTIPDITKAEPTDTGFVDDPND